MAKKFLNWPVISAVFMTMLLMISFNAGAYTENRSAGGYNTDKTDRTMIKEIYADQKQVVALLKEIINMLESSN